MSLANDYKGISDRVTVIAATTGNKTDKIRVAAYCRVSTDKTDQVNSFITQMRYSFRKKYGRCAQVCS